MSGSQLRTPYEVNTTSNCSSNASSRSWMLERMDRIHRPSSR